MPPLSNLVLILTAFNFVAFCLAGALTFDAKHAGVTFRVFVGVFLTLMGFCCGFLYVYETENLARLAVASSLLSLSAIVFVAAWITTFRKPFTVVFSPDIPTRIVTYGIYRYVRHPFYLSYMLTFIADAIACKDVTNVACAGVVVVMYAVAARLEESKFSRSELGAAYKEYKSKTGMFWPVHWAR